MQGFHGVISKITQRGSSIIALGDQGIVSATNFATGVIVGRVCGKAELGVYALVWTLISLINEVSSVLTVTPYVVFNPRLGPYERSRYLGSVFVHQLLLSLTFSLVMAFGAVLAQRWGWLSKDVSSVILSTAGVMVFIGMRTAPTFFGAGNMK